MKHCNRVLLACALASCTSLLFSSEARATTGDFQWKARQWYATNATGDFNGDGKDDVITLVPYHAILNQSTNDIWVGLSDGLGNIDVKKTANSFFAAHTGALVGDYNGDGKDDLLNFYVPNIIGGSVPWAHIELSTGGGYFTSATAPGGGHIDVPQSFVDAATSTLAPARRVSCDINGDNKDDVVLTGVSGWTSIPVAFSNGNGTFTVTNSAVTNFPTWATAENAKLACADFNGDGKDDLLLVGGAGWNSIPIAFSNGNGTFTVTAQLDSFFPVWATHANVQLVTSDFNGDGRADILLTGNSSWGTVRVGLSGGTGTFGMALSATYNLHLWAMENQAFARGGDFNGDGLGDFTLLGGADYWYTLPIGISNGDTTFTTWNNPVP